MCNFSAVFLGFIISVFLLTPSAKGLLTKEEYDSLPKIFEIDNYYKCKQNNGIFCQIKVELVPKNQSNKHDLWDAIEELDQIRSNFNHYILHHGLCQKKIPQKSEVRKIYEKRYSHLNAMANVKNIKCFTEKLSFNLFDLCLAIFFIFYCLLIFYATKKHYQSKKNEDSSFLNIFSLVRNWKKIQTTTRKHVPIEAMRTYVMASVIMFHSCLCYLAIYIDNTDYLESLFQNTFIRMFLQSGWFLVQTFFLISAWLLATQVHEIFASNAKITLGDVFLLCFNRFVRLFPAMFLLILFHKSIFPPVVSVGPLRNLVEDEYHNCQKNWWATLIFANNIFCRKEMCNSGTWYLAVDTQMYISSVFLFYFAFKYKWNVKVIIKRIAIFSIVFNMLYTFYNNYGVTLPFILRNLSFTQFIFEDEYVDLYMSTYSNIATYMIGLYFGTMYYNFKSTNFLKSKASVLMWYILFFGLPIVTIYLSIFEYSRFISAILGPLLKPVYTLGFAIGLFGLLTNAPGGIKKIFHFKPAIFLAKFNYCTYLYHFGPLLSKIAHIESAVYLSDSLMAMSIFRDLIVSFLVGIVMHLIIELPFLEIQKRFIPNVKKKKIAT